MIEETALPDVKVITPRWFGDDRGAFCETYNGATLKKHGIDDVFQQDNHSISAAVGTVRGLHFQSQPHGQAKLVRVVVGAIYDVAVDIRAGSPAYGRWVGELLSAENGKQLYVPEGFAHGFVTQAPNTEVLYKCTGLYAPAHEGSIRFDDPDLAIDWGIDPKDAILSAKDDAAPSFGALDSPFPYAASKVAT